MTEQHPQTRQSIPERALIWMIGIIAVAVVAGYYGGQYIERSRAVTPQERIAAALQAFRSGYDQSAIALFTPLAQEGNPKAQYWLADIDEHGLGVKPDIKTALALLEESAAQGFEPAEKHLGDLYLQGNETLQDFSEAQIWLRKAAATGDGAAQREIGDMYALGLGVTRDLPLAYGWYENAAINGDGLAQHLRDDLVTRMTPEQIASGEQDAKTIAAGTK